MSDFYKKSNQEGAKNLYQKSLIYELDMAEPEYANFKYFNRAEKQLYGRVSRRYVPIELSPDAPMMQLGQTNEEGTAFRVLKFVGQAFKDLSQQFRVKSMSGHIRADDPFLSVLEVKRAYESPRTLYRNYSQGRKQDVLNIFLSNRLRFKDFDEFLVQFMQTIEQVVENKPFTYPGFVKSKYCPATVSGLVIDIADFSMDDDVKKIESFKNSPNWLFYLNACRQYGFSVDADIPYRLIADIGTSEMVTYSRNTSRCRFLSTDSILNGAYLLAHKTYYDNFRNILMEYYNICKKNYTQTEYCDERIYGMFTKSEIIVPRVYTPQYFNSQYDNLTIMQIYLKIRLMEEKEILKSELDKENLLNETNQLAALKGCDYAVDYFERVIAETYDYSGSLTDLLYRDRLRREEEINVLSST